MTSRSRLLPLLALPLLLTVAACSSGGPRTVAVPPADQAVDAAPPGPVAEPALRAMLLQAGDVPTLVSRREGASTALTRQAIPQLALCKDPAPVAPHETASVIAKPARPGQAQIFELLSVYGDAAGATAAFDQAVADARACPSFTNGGRPYRLADLRVVPADGGRLLQYRLTTPDVVTGDVRSLQVTGKHLVLLSGYGAPPAGRTALQFQADVMARAVTHLAAD